MLPHLYGEYLPCNIFNISETGYFYQALPDKSLSVVKTTYKGEKLAKDRIILALVCSMTCKKLLPFIIGKSKKPSVF